LENVSEEDDDNSFDYRDDKSESILTGDEVDDGT
jgi:hypothetical protein